MWACGPPTTLYRFGPITAFPPSVKVWQMPQTFLANASPAAGSALASRAAIDGVTAGPAATGAGGGGASILMASCFSGDTRTTMSPISPATKKAMPETRTAAAILLTSRIPMMCSVSRRTNGRGRQAPGTSDGFVACPPEGCNPRTREGRPAPYPAWPVVVTVGASLPSRGGTCSPVAPVRGYPLPEVGMGAGIKTDFPCNPQKPCRAGSRSRTRTYDPAVNSRLLYRLSYPGSARCAPIANRRARRKP